MRTAPSAGGGQDLTQPALASRGGGEDSGGIPEEPHLKKES